MCAHCTIDLRVLLLTQVEALRSDPTICDRLRRAIDAELSWRSKGQDLEHADEEQL